MSARQEQSRYRSNRLRRNLILTAAVVFLSPLLIWALAHTDIVAFTTLFFAAFVLVAGTFWLTRPEHLPQTGTGRPPDLSNPYDHYREAA